VTQALRFSSIRLENWRNLGRAQADLQQRIFLVGPNASGKSNVLDVFRFLCERHRSPQVPQRSIPLYQYVHS